ncbi:hypothetical protein [Paenibacillus solanacearum]|uniref:hypothetical protein n=1 Tax=Paenibacillus solanacearum TaxID=2048548 RepID=UPI001C40861A|nr:hypothetical protein [Paenibacillus solanacearum]
MTRSSKVALRRTTPDDLEFVLCLESNEENKPYIIPWEKERHENAIKHEDMEHV